MTRPVQNFFALFWLSLPGLLLAAPDNASQPTSSSHDPGEPSSAPESVVRRLKTVAEVFGASDSISTYLAMCVLQKVITSASVSDWPSLSTMTAVTASTQRGSARPITATSLTCGRR